MYDVPYFKATDPAELRAFMQAHPFALLAGVNANRQPVATQVPVFTDERDGRLFITGHIQRKTDHHRAFEQHPDALLVFTGPHAYVSASWYSDPQQASTWNYMSVHARGRLRFLNEEELLRLLERTTAHFENNPHSPAGFHHLPPAYVQQHMKAIVAFEVQVQQLEHVFKLSQNRDRQSYDTIIDRLQEQGGEAAQLATAMQRLKQE
ncbi:MAG TPA: FMN-binding negative transcriptional regulator [Lacibacter sp.]|nr:FMN-binding negative transcriptional regulator [Lacibacter sp.]HMO87552.1 FMN-binding negative transcriptional regulator [Lacibacter sp.]HMP86865.1 FMN-binding negative transcriptional regulator [Lacibacter sp.]